jgi:hypothetical protein
MNREENEDGDAQLPQLRRDLKVRSSPAFHLLSEPPHRHTKIFSLATFKDDHTPVFLTTLYGPYDFKKNDLSQCDCAVCLACPPGRPFLCWWRCSSRRVTIVLVQSLMRITLNWLKDTTTAFGAFNALR